ncbi:hypothetical protein K1719_006254 [Acacia pycnantha]|nr:hypothetical protein K1719_006254 [Acacia pycnantha]
MEMQVLVHFATMPNPASSNLLPHNQRRNQWSGQTKENLNFCDENWVCTNVCVGKITASQICSDLHFKGSRSSLSPASLPSLLLSVSPFVFSPLQVLNPSSF